MSKQKIQASEFANIISTLVNIYLFVLQIPKVESEILVTLNDPVAISPHSSSSEAEPNSNSTGNMQLFKTILRYLKEPFL